MCLSVQGVRDLTDCSVHMWGAERREGAQEKGAEGKLTMQNWAVLLLWRKKPQKVSWHT